MELQTTLNYEHFDYEPGHFGVSNKIQKIALDLAEMAINFSEVKRVPRYTPETRESDVEHSFIEDNLVTHTIAHVFKGTINPSAVTNLRTKWVSLEQLDELETSPGTRETIDRFISSDGYFIASFDIDW